MIIIIDGYNLLRSIFPKVKGVLDQQRKQLVKQLSYYKMKKTATIEEVIIVFDAGPFLHATREIKEGVVIIFSGQKRSADEWIEEYVENHQNKDVLLVTQDRKLIQNCEKFHIQSIDIFDFYNLVKTVLYETNDKKSPIHSPHTEKYEQIDLDDYETSDMQKKALDLLMEQSSLKPLHKQEPKPEDDQGQHKKGNPLKLSKKEKKVYARLKKLH